MSRRIVILGSAKEEFKDLKKYVQRDFGDSVWKTVNAEYKDAFKRIKENPKIGSYVDELKELGIAKVRVQLLAEQSLRLEDLAKKGKFPEVEGLPEELKPEFNAVGTSTVSFSATSSSGRSTYQTEDGQSAIDLLSSSRVGEMIEVAPIETSIWVQIGAFHSKTNASNVLGKVSGIGSGQISQVDVDGQVLHRVRLGPATSVEMADDLLDGVFGLGFTGARIVVD